MSTQYQRTLSLVATLLTAMLIAITASAQVPGSIDSSPHNENIVLEANQDYNAAIEGYLEEISRTEKTLGPYASELIEPLMGLARSKLSISDFQAAILASKRAQHLIHRHQGVYALAQLESIDILIKTHLENNKTLLADKLQTFSLFISERNVGPENMALLPALQKINKWYIETGQLNHAKLNLKRSQDIITKNSGALDPQQLALIVQLAEVRRFSMNCCSYKLLVAALDIVDANPDLASQSRAEFYLQLADAYTIADKSDHAKEYYQKAWSLLDDQQRSKHFDQPHPITTSRPLENLRSSHSKLYKLEKDLSGLNYLEEVSQREKILMRNLKPQSFQLDPSGSAYQTRIPDRETSASNETEFRVIGSPYIFYYDQLRQVLPASLKNDEKLAEVQMNLEFTVDPKGKLDDIKSTNTSASRGLNRLMRSALRESRFRPRFVDGLAQETKGVHLTQTFKP